jgi:hypothetical protein
MKKEVYIECRDCNDGLYLGWVSDKNFYGLLKNECSLDMRSRSNPSRMRGVYRNFFDIHITHNISIFVETIEEYAKRNNIWKDEYNNE